MLGVAVQHISDLQLWVEGGGAVAIASGLFYLGRVLGRLDAAVRGLDRRVELLENKE